jgi:hypothetical protein
MKRNNISINIETLVLVAIWEKPFIFQGSFTITNKGDYSKKLLIFRCECNLADKMVITESDFSPNNYQFTHLYNIQSEISLINTNYALELSLYLLKYALNETLKKIITHPKQHAIHIDDIALTSISQQMENYLFYRQEKNLGDSGIGFAVAIDFTPAEELGQTAALTLLELASISFQ